MARPQCDTLKRWWSKKFQLLILYCMTNNQILVYNDQFLKNHCRISDWNPLLVANYNRGNPSVNKDFLTSILMDAMDLSLRWTSTWCPPQNGCVTLVLTTLMRCCPKVEIPIFIYILQIISEHCNFKLLKIWQLFCFFHLATLICPYPQSQHSHVNEHFFSHYLKTKGIHAPDVLGNNICYTHLDAITCCLSWFKNLLRIQAWRAPKSWGETHLRVPQNQVAKSWDLGARSRLPTLKKGRGSSWEPRD
jgi:hypothetical protein